ncbi:MAG TPA: DUF99 family protein [Methanoregulaceae archaeon]|nr:DUF99 family protein [Methanoregulaceae archaeon]HRY75987.1 DUF99 family protein [Methanoregulaceae archaeon]
MHIPKKGLRALGIAESYSGRSRSTLAGVVMRKDRIIDGFAFHDVTVGGTDATDAVLAMVRDLDRQDINAILLSGCVIAWFNVLDPDRVFVTTGIPVICVTYEESDGLSADIQHHFPGDDERLSAYEKLGDRVPFVLSTGQTVFLRSWGLPEADAARLCDAFTLEGKIPEPLRVARLCARHLPPCPGS